MKIIEKAKIKKFNAEKMLAREINIHSFVDHPNIISLYGFFHDDERIYLILEYAPDGDLFKEMKEMAEKKFSE